MTPKSKNILVGMFVIFLSLGAIAFITWLGSTAIREETDTYLAYLEESVSGLSQNSPVKYKGVSIGQVEKIRINPNNSNQVELRLIIKRGTPIKVDSELVLTPEGITGLEYIEITGGSEEAESLKAKPGEEFPIIPSSKSTFAAVEDAIGPMLSNLNIAIEDIRKILEGSNLESLENILSDVESITGNIASKSDAIIQDFNQTSTDFQQMAAQSNQLVSNANEFFNLRKDQIVALMSKMDHATNAFNGLLGTIEQEKVIGNLGQTIIHVNRLLEQFEEEQVVQGVGKTMQTANRLMTRIEQEQIVEGVGKTVTNVGQLVENLEQTATKADQFVTNLNQTGSKMDQFVANLNQATDNVNQFVNTLNETAGETDKFVASLNQTATKIDQLIDNLNHQTSKKELQSVPQSINTTLQEIQKLVKNLNQTTEEADFSATIEDFKEVLADVQILVQTWTQVAIELEKKPSALIFGSFKEEIRIVPQ